MASLALSSGVSNFEKRWVCLYGVRVVIYLLLGVVVLSAGGYGAYLMWRSVFPVEEGVEVTDEGGNLIAPVVGRRLAILFFLLVVILFLWIVVDRVWVGSEVPDDLVVAPAVKSQGVVSDRYY